MGHNPILSLLKETFFGVSTSKNGTDSHQSIWAHPQKDILKERRIKTQIEDVAPLS
jgi:hypothetical protein